MADDSERGFRGGRALGAAVCALLCVGLAIGPQGLVGGSAFTQQDAAFSAVALAHLQDVLLGRDAPAPLAYPLADALWQTDWMLGPAALTLPLRVLGVAPWTVYTIAAAGGLWVTVWAMAVAARGLLGSGPHVWVAAMVGGLSASNLLHAHHVNLVYHGVPWLGILMVVDGVTSRRPWRAATGGALVAAGFHFGVYVGLHGLLAAVPVALWAAWFAASDQRPREAAAALAGFAAVAVSVVPVLLAYRAAYLALDATVSVAELHGESLDLVRLMAPLAEAWAHRPLAALWPVGRASQDPPNPGYLATVLAILGMVAVARGRAPVPSGWPAGTWRALVAVAVVAAGLALGPDVVIADVPWFPAPYRLLHGVPGFAGLRAPDRWLAVVWPVVGLLAAAGMREVSRACSTRAGRGAWSALAVLGTIALELPQPALGPVAALAPPPLYDALDALPPGAVADVIQGDEPGRACTGQQRMFAVLAHRRALAGGRFARKNAALAAIDKIGRTWPSASARSMYRAIGVRVLVEHPPLASAVPPEASCRVVEGHRLCVLPNTPILPNELTASPVAGPVVAIRFPAPAPAAVNITCDGVSTRVSTRPWAAVAAARRKAWVDVPLATPCAGVVEASGATPLWAVTPSTTAAPALDR